MNGERVRYLDVAKVLCTILVVLGHLYPGNHIVNQYIYGFHMPLFFLLSGVFHRESGSVQWKKYAVNLLWPTIVFIVIDFGFHCVRPILIGENVLAGAIEFIKVTVYRYVRGMGNGIYWFLVALFWCKVLSDIYLCMKAKWLFVIIGALLLFFPNLHSFYLPFMISQCLMAMPFYLIGFYLKNKITHLALSPYYVFPAIVLLAISILLSYYNGKISMLGVSWGKLPLYISVPVFYINGLIGSAGIVCLSLVHKASILWESLGRSLITTVGIQGIFCNLYRLWLGDDTPLALSVFTALVIMAACYFLHKLLAPIYRYPLQLSFVQK